VGPPGGEGLRDGIGFIRIVEGLAVPLRPARPARSPCADIGQDQCPVVDLGTGLSATTFISEADGEPPVADRSDPARNVRSSRFRRHECDQCTARHGVLRHEDHDLGLVLPRHFGDGVRPGRVARRVQHEIDWHTASSFGCAHHVFGIVDVSVSRDSKPRNRIVSSEPAGSPVTFARFRSAKCCAPAWPRVSTVAASAECGEDEK
jgi:hypothetical protein